MSIEPSAVLAGKVPFLTPLHGVEPLHDDRLDEFLRTCQGTYELTPEARQWFRAALTHYAYLYGHKELYPGVNHNTLAVLRNIGSMHLSLYVLRNVVQDAPQSNLTYRHEKLVLLEPAVRNAIAENRLIGPLAYVFEPQFALETGLAEARHPNSRRKPAGLMRESIALQFLGLLSVYRLKDAADDILLDAYNAAKNAMQGALNYGDLFERHVAHTYAERDGLLLEAERESLGHPPTFRARVVTPDGNIGIGGGASKRDAIRAAKINYLSKYRPDLLKEPDQGRIVMPPDSKDLPTDFVVAAGNIGVRFGADRNSKYFQQALVHASWANENLHGNIDHSNVVLSHLGSFAINELVARIGGTAWLRLTSRPDQYYLDMASTVSSRSISTLFEPLDIEDQLLLSRGMQGSMNTRLATNTVQAIFGAAYISHDFNIFRLEENLPAPVSKWFAGLVASGRAEKDFTARRHMLFLDLAYDDDITRSGPMHDSIFECTASVRSAALDEEVALRGTGSSKQAARNDTMMAFSAALSHFTNEFSPDSAERAPSGRAEMAYLHSFIVRHQLAALPQDDIGRLKWIQNGYLGAGMLARGSYADFRQWSDFAMPYLGQLHSDSGAASRIRRYYAQSVDQQIRQSDTFANIMDEVLAWVRACAGESPRRYTQDRSWQLLLALCAAQKVRLTDGDPRLLHSVVDDWLVLQARRLPSGFEVSSEDEAVISGSIAAGIIQCLTELAGYFPSSGMRMESRRVSEGSAEISLSSDDDWVPAKSILTTTCLVSDVISGMQYRASSKRVCFRVDCATVNQVNLLAKLASSGSSNELDGEVARVLHDLKNEMYAAEVSASTSIDSATRAPGHLAEALRLGRRLAGVSYLYAVTRVQTIYLAEFFQSYIADKTETIPADILIEPPQGADVTVLGSSVLLRAALDNLVNNSVDAMPHGGRITFFCSADNDGGLVALEICDSGPGIPGEVLEAVLRGQSAYSKKIQGSGLGLVCTRQFIRRMKGTLTPAVREGGHGWVITLPLAVFQESP